VTLCAALMLTMQVLPVPEHPAPLQPPKVLPVAAVALSVTLAPLVKVALQIAPQLMPVRLLSTVPEPVPCVLTVSALVPEAEEAVKIAVTFCAVLIVTTQEPVPEHPAPLQPPKVLPVAAVALSVTLESLLYVALQSAPQLMPDGLLSTVPEPVPCVLTVSVLVPEAEEVKMAVTFCAVLILTTHEPVPEHPAPLQPPKVLPVAAVALSVTLAPLVKVALQIAPQLMPVKLLSTVPEPVPCGLTVSVLVPEAVEVKMAVTFCAVLILTTHKPVPEHPAPLQPPKVLPVAAVALSVTLAPLLKVALQGAAQLMPAGLLSTVPEPVPCGLTVRPNWAAIPVPAKLTLCELPGALLVMVMAPVRVPSAVGLKKTLIEQLETASRVAAIQSFV